MSLDYEKQYYSEKVKFIAGCDEAGRGCLLGPVVAAAVILPQDYENDLINDSKQLSEKKREKLFDEIVNHAIAWGVGVVPPEKIDEINILNASKLAMEMALMNMKHDYDFVLTDAVVLKNVKKPLEAIIKGDAKAQCIAAASIIAKVTRDRMCIVMDKLYPEYKILKNKGYGTKDHLEALKKYGPVKGLHRFSYAPVQKSMISKISLFDEN